MGCQCPDGPAEPGPGGDLPLPLCADHEGAVEFAAGALVLLDKPEGRSSFWLVRRLRALTGVRTIGHGGTLDPFATGLMVMLVGKAATRLQDRVTVGDKGYRALFRLGATSDSHDRTGTVTTTNDSPTQPFEDGTLRQALERLRGPLLQIPPMHSAIHHQGKRLYELARRGEQVERAPREVTVHRLEVLSWQWPWLELEILCSKGTYIRSLARDLGEDLGCGALVQELRRTASGPYRLEQAVDLETVARLAGRLGEGS